MLGTRNSSILSLIVIAGLALPAGAQNRVRATDARPLTITPAQRTFGQDYVAAVRSPDIERYKKLLHPRTRKCINSDNADFYKSIFERRIDRFVKNPSFSVERVRDPKMFSAARSNGLNYPARPSHVLHITLNPQGGKVSAYIVREAGLWYEVLPCPSSRSLDMMREAQRRDAAETVRARALADSIDAPLRAELLAILQEEGPVVATKRYAEATQAEPALARRVVKALEKDLTLIH
jgi:hypothetical protein